MSDDHPVDVRSSEIQSRLLDESIGGFKCVELVGHAREQMEIRGLTEADVLNTLRAPDETSLPTAEGRKRVRRYKTARVAMDVVYEERGAKLIVVTVIRFNRRISGRKPR